MKLIIKIFDKINREVKKYKNAYAVAPVANP